MQDTKLRNVAIIAHVGHGKTTLVDKMLKRSGIYRENQATVERVMGSSDLERERDIAILAKNTTVHYKDVKINIVDTPGHIDFDGEVGRILKIINDVILLMDAAEDPMPQTRFVLSKALELGHKVIVVINKVDRPDQRIREATDEVLELLLDLSAIDEQFESPTLLCSGRQGTTPYSSDMLGTDLVPLFKAILSYVPVSKADTGAPFQILVSSIDYNEFVGRITIDRIERGIVKQNQEIAICNFHQPDATPQKAKATALYQFDGLGQAPVTGATAGSIIAISDISEITIGDTICASDVVEPIEFMEVSTPTIETAFSINDSPFAGKESKFITSHQIRERLFCKTMKNVSLRVTETDSTDAFSMAGWGETNLSILIETMRRGGYEFQVSPPRVLYQEIDGKIYEPVERLVVNVSNDSVGAIIEKTGAHKGDLLEMAPVGDQIKLEFLVPSHGLFGYRNEFLTGIKGEGIMASVFGPYTPMKGEIQHRNFSSLMSFETGGGVTYGLYSTQECGMLFISANVPVYADMVVSETPKQEDISANICKKRQLTNMRASGPDDALRLTPPRQIGLEQYLEFLADDELLKVTPKSLRLRERLLDHAIHMRETSRERG